MSKRPEAGTSIAGREPPSREFPDTLDLRIAAMRAVVEASGAGSTADALRLLREAFPDASLADRVAALEPGPAS